MIVTTVVSGANVLCGESGDARPDVIWGGGDTIGWYVNDNAMSGKFRPLYSGAQTEIACNATGVRKVVPVDVDADGDIDVIGTMHEN